MSSPTKINPNVRSSDIAVIGMSCRLPEANNIEEFWKNLRNGRESVTFFSDQELLLKGVSRETLRDTRYVKAGIRIEGIDLFDAGFFGYSAREAELMDPQQRLFLEAAWEVIEKAGYDPHRYEGLIGVYAGIENNGYVTGLKADGELMDRLAVRLGNDKDYVATRVSHKLNLRGPSFNVQTACSTSLVAIHLACQALLEGECDMALAGGVAISVPQQVGYLYQEGGVYSSDGRCRPFDAKAEGTIPGEGLGVVLLKRLRTALEEDDNVYAVIRGSAINNDGLHKVSFTAPSVSGQAEVIQAAHIVAEVNPETISYVEAHGTATALGDPIEIAALTEAFRRHTGRKQFCGIGSVKGNLGHTGAAAGVIALIKTALALHHRQIPASLNCETPNPVIDFEQTPFFVNTSLSAWPGARPFRAGVSSFGLGGTNAHVIMEEAPPSPPSGPSRPSQLLILSARTNAGLRKVSSNLAGYLESHPEVNLADTAYTLHTGRKEFACRRAVVCKDREQAIAFLRTSANLDLNAVAPETRPTLAFVFPGDGSHLLQAGKELYDVEPEFRQTLDYHCDRLGVALGLPLLEVLYPPADRLEWASACLASPAARESALFALEYTLARLWIRWGLQPDMIVGHGVGEYVAACIAGVFSFDDAMKLLAARATVMLNAPGQSLIDVRAHENTLRPLLPDGISVVAVDGQNQCIVSGTEKDLCEIEKKLGNAGILHRRLDTLHGPTANLKNTDGNDFERAIHGVSLRPPRLPYISGFTGERVGEELATPGYWTRQLRGVAGFHCALQTVLKTEPAPVLLEIGPGATLRGTIGSDPGHHRGEAVLASLHGRHSSGEPVSILDTLGKLWTAGLSVDWKAFYAAEKRRRVSLPGYPFERQRYWAMASCAGLPSTSEFDDKAASSTQLYLPFWKPALLDAALVECGCTRWLLFVDDEGIAAELALEFLKNRHQVSFVRAGDRFSIVRENEYTLDPRSAGDYCKLLSALLERDRFPQRILHLWTITSRQHVSAASLSEDLLYRGFNSFLYLRNAVEKIASPAQLEALVISNGIHAISEREEVWPEKAALLAWCNGTQQSARRLKCRSVDVSLPAAGTLQRTRMLAKLLAETMSAFPGTSVAHRGGQRWTRSRESAPFNAERIPPSLTPQGTYLVCGELSELVFKAAEYLLGRRQGRVIYLQSSSFHAEPGGQAWRGDNERGYGISREKTQIQFLRDMGCEIIFAQPSASGPERLEQTITSARRRFGPIYGLVVVSGQSADDALASEPADLDKSLLNASSQLEDLLAFETLLQMEPIEFSIFLSSSHGVGSEGLVARDAFHKIIHAFIHNRQFQSGLPWTTVNWGEQADAEAMPGGHRRMSEHAASILDEILRTNPAFAEVVESSCDDTEFALRAQGLDENDGSRAVINRDKPVPYAAPQTSTEALLCELWENLLGIERVGVHDDFFELDGNSLTATQFLSRLPRSLADHLSLRTILEFPTVAQLARIIAEGTRTVAEEHRATGLDIQPRPAEIQARPERLPASYVQRRLWFVDQLEGGSTQYNLPGALRLIGELDILALERAISTVLERHEVLRTSYKEIEGELVQEIAPTTRIALPIEDLSGLDLQSQQQRVSAAMQDEWDRPFDLERGPAWRMKLLRTGPQEHFLLQNFHHIAFDGWSEGILNREMAALYEAFSQERANPLPRLPLQYADFALWQQQFVNEKVLAAELSYWKEQLEGLPPEIELPSDRPRPNRPTFAADVCHIILPAEQANSLGRLCRNTQSTLYMALLSIFVVLLSRYSGKSEIVVGSPIANREDPRFESLIGCFVNTLVMRLRVNSGESFLRLLLQVRETALQAYQHQNVPFEKLVEELSPVRRLNATPIYQVVFASQNAPAGAEELKNLKIERRTGEGLRVRFDLEVHVRENDGQIHLHWIYSKDLFDKWRIEQMARQYKVLVDSVLQDPHAALLECSMLDEAEQRQLAPEWEPHGPLVPAFCLHELFAIQVRKTPERTAVVHGSRSMTYGELDQQSSQLACYLREKGVGQATRVGIFVARGFEMLVGILGILKAGAAYVPFEPDIPDERLKYLLKDSGIEILLTQEGLTDKLPENTLQVLCLDKWSGSFFSNVTELPKVDSAHAAYVIYTSGSTGAPKGVEVTHDNVVHLFEATRKQFDFDEQDRWTLFHSYAFDFSVWEIWGALLYGGRLIIVPQDITRSPREFLRLLIKEKVTVLNQTPSAFYYLAAAEAEDQDMRAELSLRVVIFGGEALDLQALRPWVERHGDKLPRLVNMYGITETTVHVTYCPVRQADLQQHGSLIGAPLKHLRVYVLGPHMELAPRGVPGEIYVGGAGVARGYVNLPELTAARFVPDPFSRMPGSRLYRSGDLARYRSDGTLEYIGRIDNQVKLRGFRIELGEIEAVLMSHPDIAQAAVIVREDNLDQKRLVAYVVPVSQRVVDTTVLLKEAARKLPQYMVPSALVLLDSMPLTSNGKLDTKALPDPGLLAPTGRAPRTPVEKKLCELFADVLGSKSPTLDDDFFALGGHSLLATRLVSRVRAVFGAELSLRALFEYPTVAGLAACLEEQRSLRPALCPQTRPPSLPLSYAQRRLWFIDRLQGGSTEYNVPQAVRIRGEFNVEAMREAIAVIVARHESMRTRFAQYSEEPVQIIDEAAELDIPIQDLSSLDAPAQREHVSALLRNQWNESFDLAHGPLFRFQLVKLAEKEHIFLQTFHHIICDGWSLGIFNRELSLLYDAGSQPTLEPLPIQYADFALWQRAWLNDAAITAQAAYWKKQLADLPEQLLLPQDRPRPERQTFAGSVHTLELPDDLLASMARLCRGSGATLYMALLAAFAVLLERYTQQRNIVVGSPIANRQEIKVEQLIGFFLNTLAMRVRVDPGHSFEQLLHSTKNMCLDAYLHQDLPFEKLVEELAPQRLLNVTPIFQTIFTLQNSPVQAPQLNGLKIEPILEDELRVRFDLEVHARERELHLELLWVYNRDLFDHWRIQQMASHFERLIRSAVNNPIRPLRELEMLSEAEIAQILRQSRGAGMAYPRQFVHQLFEQQAANTPEMTAVMHSGSELTYAELNRRANQLARTLQKAGAAPEAPVSICMERCLDACIAVLAILKAGAAYVPLDPKYPSSRLSYMLKNSGAQVLVTRKRFLDPLAGMVKNTICLDDSESGIAWQSDENLQVAVQGENLAYVIYTSGSTGNPKGVAMPHDSLANLVQWQLQQSPGMACTTLQFASLSFDVSFQEIFATWCAGGRLVLVDDGIRRDPAELWRFLCENQVARIFLPAVALQQLVEAAATANIRACSLREIITAGEQLKTSTTLQATFERLPLCRLENQYGPTESHVVTAYPLGNAPSQWAAFPPIGRAVANVQVYVLDENFLPAPVGVPGELYLGGAQLARGYIHSPELTAERFLPNPFSGGAGGRLYKTGDKARFLQGGNIEFLGRTDNQVKIRGYRIELSEIEAVLRSHEQIKDALVIVQEVQGIRQLVAYVLPADHQADSAEVQTRAVAAKLKIHNGEAGLGRYLRQDLRKILPDHMIPSSISVLRSWPLTVNGKIDRSALPKPSLSETNLPPQSPQEEILCSLFAEILGLDSVGRDEDFFQLGGHSLMATRLASRIRTALGLEIPLRTLFESPTVTQLAHCLDRPGSPRPPVAPREHSAGVPLSYSQQRLWFVDRFEGTSTQFNLPHALRLRGKLDLAALKKTISAIAERHESLRTRFVEVDGQPVQLVQAELPIDVGLENLSGLPEQEQWNRVKAIQQSEWDRPFDLASGLLWRVRLLKLDECEHVLLQTFHHLVSDGWSLGVFVREFGALYEAFCGPDENLSWRDVLDPLPVQYADFALWQQEWIASDAMQDDVDYWKRKLTDIPNQLQLPTDHPRPRRQSFAAGFCELSLPQEQVIRLKALCKACHSTLYMSLLSGLALLLSRYSGQDDIVIGSPIANRRDVRLEDLIGFFVNSLALRTQPAPDMTFRELLLQVRSTALDAYLHQDLPFERLLEVLAPGRRLNTTPVFQVMFALQNAPLGPMELKGLEVERLTSKDIRVHFDIEVHAWEEDNHLDVLWVYSRALFDSWRMEQMLRHWKQLLDAALDAPDVPLRNLQMLTPEEHSQLIGFNNRTSHDFPRHKRLPDLFEEQAARTPEAMAAVSGTRKLSYAELNTRSNRLAHQLIELGAAPGRCIGIHLERSLDMLVGVLAVLKSGSYYLPLDPAYPLMRVMQLLADADPVLVLSADALADRLPQTVQTLSIDAPDTLRALTQCPGRNPSDEDRRERLLPLHPAYITYTSGSTGIPKGILATHTAVVNFLTWAVSFFDEAELASVLAASSLNFDFSTFEMFPALCAGGTIEIVPDLLALTENSRGKWIGSFMSAVPSAFSVLLEQKVLHHDTKILVFGGEALPPKLVDDTRALLPDTRIGNFYGPTEATVYSTAWCSPAGSTQAPSIGKPIWNRRTYVLDEFLNPVPIGVTGELYLGGEGLACGYLGRFALTAERFVADPYTTIEGSRMYRTGDLVRWNARGDLEYIGRTDLQVKVHGYRIELGEIEAALREYEEIAQAVATVREDQPGEKYIAVYVVNKPGAKTLDSFHWRNRLKQRLPNYMVPAIVVELPALPLTGTGKIDRQALPVPGREGPIYCAPRTPQESALCDIFAALLDLPQVGIHDDFFSIGGHSLLATRLVSKVRATMGLELPLHAVFETSTVAGLASRLGESFGPREPLSPEPRPENIPLSYAQQRVWFIDQLKGSSAEYNMPWAVLLSGPLDFDALQQAINAIIQRHESLRTHFSQIDGSPVQIIEAELKIDLPLEDLSLMDKASQQQHLAEAMRQEWTAPFDLATGPLLRARLFCLSENEHVFIRNVHHIVFDGWSHGVFTREVSELYEAFAEHRQHRLSPLPVQYADFALWQRKWLNEDALAFHLEYWKERISGAPEELMLPKDHTRRAVQTFTAEVCEVALSLEQLQDLKSLSYSSQATLYMTLLAGFSILLQRYCGQDDVVVGTPIANRQDASLEPLIGFFVNSLAMRVKVDPTRSFLHLVESVREVAMSAYLHQDLPFERLVEELSPQRHLNMTPIFQVLFALQNAPAAVQRLHGLEIHPAVNDVLQVHVDLEVHTWEREGRLEVFWVYNCDLFDRWRVEQMARHYVHLLQAAVQSPDLPLHRLAMLSGSERQQILVQWNRTQRIFPEQATVIELFERRAAMTPQAVCLVHGRQKLTYAELDRRTNRLARYLKKCGVGPESKVGVFVERSVDMVVALLGILKAEGAYIPLDPAYPPERLEFMLSDAGVNVLLANRHLIERLKIEDHVCVVVVEDWPEILQAESENTFIRHSPATTAAYVIYTSGSTGRPKGVIITHLSLANLLAAMSEIEGLKYPFTLLSVTTISFDMSVPELYLPLVTGGTLVLVDRKTAVDGNSLKQLLAESSATVFHATPATWSILLDAGWKGPIAVLCGAEALNWSLAHSLLERATLAVNFYGPTETTVWSSSYDFLSDRKRTTAVVPIGKPLLNTYIYVLGSNLELLPVGVTGDLYIAGTGLARGYLHRPALTAERFAADPYGSPGTRMYRTGDLAFWRNDGVLEFVGRADHQVKVRGFRIELGEIEAALRKHPSIHQAAIVVREDQPGNKELTGYLIANEGCQIDTSELRNYLKQQLPAYMVPYAWVQLDRLPLNPNGKLDRKALPAPDDPKRNQYTPPRTETELIIADIWSELLQLKKVGVHDNFFALGGHSLLATRLVSRVRDALGVEVAVRTLFESPTIAELIGRLEKPAEQQVPLLKQERQGPLPLSFAQQRLWFVDQMGGGASSEYNLFQASRLRGELDLSAFTQALSIIVDRHEILRTHFMERAGQPFQVITPPAPVSVPVDDLTDWDETGQQKKIAAALREERERPFDLARGPLFRTRLLKLREGEYIFSRTFHHTIFDAWSQSVFNQEFITLYEALHEGRPPALEPLPLQYADFALWQRTWLTDQVLRRELDYWEKQLSGIPEELPLPADRPRPLQSTFAAGICTAFLPAEKTSLLHRLAHAGKATPYMTLLAAFAVLLQRYSRQDDVVIGSPIANRQEKQLEPLIGFFVNSLVMRVQVSAEMSFLELLSAVRATALGAYLHQNLPFEYLVKELAPRRSLNRAPLYQVLFALQNVPSFDRRLHSLEVEALSGEHAMTGFDLELYAAESDGRVEFHCIYSRDLFDHWRVEGMLRHYSILLDAILSHPDGALCEFDMLAEAEKRQLLVEWNSAEYIPVSGCVHQWFASRVARQPDAVAISATNQQLTYIELDRRTNRLARYLKTRGIGAESMVGICLERSIEMMVAVLGVLKAGAAYVPLDVNYPLARLKFMANEGRLQLVLTSRARIDVAVQIGKETFLLEDEGQWGDASHAPLEVAVDPEQLAYVIFTSGSTGTPKGVAVTHRGLANYISWCCEAYSVSQGSGTPVISGLGFDLTITSIFPALITGKTVELMDDVEHLAATLLHPRAYSLLKLTPSHLKLLPSDLGKDAAAALVLGGEALYYREINEWLARGTRVFNEYGPTESTVGCCVFEAKYGRMEDGAVPIGRPILNTQLYVLDEGLHLVPCGVAGELYIAGAGLAREYMEQPSLTAERFLPHPFSSRPGERIYRTGDLAKWRADGTLEFLGRLDDQVKIRGFRIELKEIESVVVNYPGVSAAAVVVHEPKPDDRRLIAYVVAQEGLALNPAELRNYARSVLPAYMLPAQFVLVSGLPLTPNGKLDRQNLPAPEIELLPEELEAPRAGNEDVLAQIWAESLGFDQIGLDDNFFDIGGHSLLLPGIRAAIRERLGISLPVVELFKHSTVRSLARHLTQADEQPIDMTEPEQRMMRQRLYLQSRRQVSVRQDADQEFPQ